MHSIDFIQDFTIILITSAIVTILFHRLKQPVVLGYITAGAIIGPFTPGYAIIHDEQIIKTLAELGVVFLMFSLGLEFNLRKLFKVGVVACVAASTEILTMTFLGYEMGQYFHWNTIDSLFLGGMLAISSTTIIIKALQELGLAQTNFAQMIFGILIVEDILGIVILTLLSAIAVGGSVSANTVMITLSQISSFIVISLILGVLLVPRILNYVAKFNSPEMLLITTLALCFGFCLIVMELEYSLALGAFIIGAIIAEAKQIQDIEHLIEPLTNMFSMIFFVTIGLLLDPAIIITYAWPILLITIVVVVGKVLSCTFGTFIAGYDARTSLRVGMSIAQIGEFSFIIATLGLTLGVTSQFLYPIVVAVSAITTLLTPYLIKSSDPLANYMAKKLPKAMQRLGEGYTNWLNMLNEKEGVAAIMRVVRYNIMQILINVILIAGIFCLAVYFSKKLIMIPTLGRNSLMWSLAFIFSLPFLIAIYRKTQTISSFITENGNKSIMSELLPISVIVLVMSLPFLMSASILPRYELVIATLVLAALVVILWWRWLVRLHIRVQIALIEKLRQQDKKE
jgi:CPA2 family monovalent cation:H+ antiporter-2